MTDREIMAKVREVQCVLSKSVKPSDINSQNALLYACGSMVSSIESAKLLLNMLQEDIKEDIKESERFQKKWEADRNGKAAEVNA